MLVSFGAQSFPRKRESTTQTFGSVLLSDWIPAFAGMTGGSSGSPFHMTSVPDELVEPVAYLVTVSSKPLLSSAGKIRQTPGARNPHPVLLPHLPLATYQLEPALPHLPHTVYHTPSTTYLLFFQQRSRFQRVTIFVFCNIPALPPPLENRPFVFIDIPASFLHFLKLLVSSSPVGADTLSRAAMPAKSPLHPSSLECSRQSAVSSRQLAASGKQLAVARSN